MRPEEILADAGKPANYYPDLAKITGSITTAILLSYLLKWAGIEKIPDGWITKKPEEIEQETGLSKIELQDARNELKAKGFIEDKQVTSNSIYYRVNAENVKSKMGTLTTGKKEQARQKTVITELTEDGVALSYDMVQDVSRATPYADMDNNAIEGFISLYGLKKVISILDILASQYKAKPEPVNNPTLVLAKSFVKGVVAPDNHVSYFERLKKLKATEASLRMEDEKRAALEPKPAEKQKEIKIPDMGLLP
jgi:hypothetical protein